MPIMLIATGSLTRGTLTGEVAVVTGAGGGIGFAAARALVRVRQTLAEQAEGQRIVTSSGPFFAT